MFIDNNLIAYEYYKNQYVPNEIYYSGEKEETSLINKYSDKKELAVLILEDDIVNNDGYGLKKGFYNIIPDEYNDFLLIYQSAKLKAKVPIVEVKVVEPSNPKQEKPKKMSQRAYKHKQEKEYRKYIKGINPSEVEYKTAEIQYVQEKNAWAILYKADNLELFGVIKF